MSYFDMMNPVQMRAGGKKVAILGANDIAKRFLASEPDYEVLAVTDVDDSLWGKVFEGHEVKSPSALKALGCPVLVMDPDYVSASALLDWLGVEPYFHWETAVRLENDGSNNNDIAEDEVFTPKLKLSYDGWNKHNRYTHAMGIIDDIKFTNSLEAFNATYAKGIKVFECDITKDKNNVFYLCHGRTPIRNIFRVKGDTWYRIMKNEFNTLDEIGFPVSFEQYSKEKIYGRYTPLTVEDLIGLMETHPDISLIVDAKTDMESIFLKLASLDKDGTLFSKIMFTCTIPALEQFCKAKGHEKIQAILLRDGDMDADLPDRRSSHNQFIRTCLEYGIKKVEVNENRVKNGFAELAAKYGVEVCIPVTNADSNAKIDEFEKLGVTLFEIRSN